jgi:hypothetical protein
VDDSDISITFLELSVIYKTRKFSFLGLSWTVILPISASSVAGITGLAVVPSLDLFFECRCPIIPVSYVERTLFSCISFAILSKISWLYLCVYFWFLYSVLLIYLFIHSLVPHCLGYCHFKWLIISLEVRKFQSSLDLFLQGYIGYYGSFVSTKHLE